MKETQSPTHEAIFDPDCLTRDNISIWHLSSRDHGGGGGGGGLGGRGGGGLGLGGCAALNTDLRIAITASPVPARFCAIIFCRGQPDNVTDGDTTTVLREAETPPLL